MDVVWIQMAAGVAGSLLLGVVTNLITPAARRVFARVVRRSRRRARRMLAVSRAGVARRIARPIRRVAAAVRA
jgi:hypothetical protein